MPKQTSVTMEGPRINILDAAKRHLIVKAVVNHFIEFEHSRKAAGVKFAYPVESLEGGAVLRIARPGHKKNFDFKVAVLPDHGLGGGSHEELAADIAAKAQGNRRAFDALWSALTEIYHCRANDVDKLLASPGAQKHRTMPGATPEVLLKVLKWCFIMEDIVYWDNAGRAFLYNWLLYRANESDAVRLAKVQKAIKWDPSALRKYLPGVGLEWVACEG